MLRYTLYGILPALAVGTGLFAYQWSRPGNTAQAYGAPFTLVDQRGETITEKAFRDHPTAIFFGFTHCPEICPTTLFELDGWLAELGDEGKDIRAFFVSVDPERDTPEVLGDYVSSVSQRIIGITGEPDKIAEMVKDFRIYAKRIELDDGDYTMDHTASVILLDSNGAFAGTIAYGEDPDTAMAKLKRLASG